MAELLLEMVQYTENHGVKWGSYNGKSDVHSKLDWKPHINFWAKDEGLLPFMQNLFASQTGSWSQRHILTQVYKNQPPGE